MSEAEFLKAYRLLFNGTNAEQLEAALAIRATQLEAQEGNDFEDKTPRELGKGETYNTRIEEQIQTEHLTTPILIGTWQPYIPQESACELA